MDSEPAVARIVLPATSVLDDVGFVALADIAALMGSQKYRVIGGHMVTKVPQLQRRRRPPISTAHLLAPCPALSLRCPW